MASERCDACRGEGVVIVSEWNDQYDRTHASYDTCPGCGGAGEIEVEADDDNEFQRIHDSDKTWGERNGG